MQRIRLPRSTFRPRVVPVLLSVALVSGCRPADVAPAVPPPAPLVVPQDPVVPLAIGDPAPAIDVSDWISPGARGIEPFRTFAPGTIYVLEFWSPWSPFCRKAVPVVDRLAAESPHDVVVVGITHEDAADVRLFLDQLPEADRPRYCLAADPDGSVHRAYLEAIAETGIPTAFLIGRDGRVDWIGHPNALAKPLREVVEGTFDRAAFAAEFRAERRLAARVEEIGFSLAAGRNDAAITDARRLVTEAAGNAGDLNEVAWKFVKLATDSDVPPAILDVAEDAARQSLALSPTDGNTFDTLAHVQERRGDLDAAIASQRQAVEHAGDLGQPFREFLADLEARRKDRDAVRASGPEAAPAAP